MICRIYPVPGTRYVCKSCGAESPTGIGYVCQTAGPLPAPAAECPNLHGATWPAQLAGRGAVWACCVSGIGPTCQHLAPAGR